MIDPAYLGEPPQVFTLSYRPETGQRSWGVVLCPPVGAEYVNSFRALRVLATRLQAHAIPVLRLDYSGTGDSAGQPEQFGLSDWRQDIDRVVDHARVSLGVGVVALVGLRLGATLALEVASGRSGIGALVLWEPIGDGAAYLEELRGRHAEWLQRTARELPGIVRGEREEEYFGFRFSDTARRELREIEPARTPGVVPAPVLIIDEGTGVAPELEARLRGTGASVTRQVVAPQRVWGAAVGLEQPLVPAGTLGEIVTWLAQRIP